MVNDNSDSRYIQVPLTQGNIALIDEADECLLEYKWNVLKTKDGSRYVRRNIRHLGKASSAYLHRAVMERALGRPLAKGESVDHINRNGLDCRRCNLRVATNSQNSFNKAKLSTNKSGYKGVSRVRGTDRWHARITCKGQDIHLGYFSNPKDAAIAWNKSALLYHGEFAVLNVIPED